MGPAEGSSRALDKKIADIQEILEALPQREPGEIGGTDGLYAMPYSDMPLTITVDLGRVFAVDRIVLIPTRLQNVEGEMEVVGFPTRFEILGSKTADFESSVRFVAESGDAQNGFKGYPVLFAGNGEKARYVRVVVHDSTRVRDRIAVSLAELFVFSEGRNVALGKSVEAPGSTSWEGFFDAAFLVDGQTSLGQPKLESLSGTSARGWHAKVQEEAESGAFVELRFETAYELDEIRLYPVYHTLFPKSTDYGFPLRFLLQVHDPETGWVVVVDWSQRRFPRPGNSPVYFPIDSRMADGVRLQALEAPLSIPGRYIFALAEMEVYANGVNIAPQAEIVSSPLHYFDLDEWNEQALTDGHATKGKIIPLLDWLEGLAKRGRMESRLKTLSESRLEQQQRLTRALRVAVVVLSVSLLGAGTLLVLNRMKRHRQLRKLQSQIASDLHDDIGSNLASMTILASGVQESCPRGSAHAKSLERMVDIAKETSSSMRDIVWMLHPDRKANISLTAKLMDIASSLLADTNFDFCESAEVNISQLSMDKLHHFLLFYKETLHNLARHSDATRVEITIAVPKNRILLSIRDNGTPPSSGNLPDGLQLRAKKMNAKLGFESSNGENRLDLEF